MPESARIGDIWVGICCCHQPPKPCVQMSGTIISGSPNIYSSGAKQARVGDTVIGDCGHTGTISSGSPNHISNSPASARVGDSVAGCTIGTIVTGNSIHIINN